MSKHQPDFINGIFNGEESVSNIIKLKSIVKGLRNNKVPILIADDTTVSQMREYLE